MHVSSKKLLNFGGDLSSSFLFTGTNHLLFLLIWLSAVSNWAFMVA